MRGAEGGDLGTIADEVIFLLRSIVFDNAPTERDKKLAHEVRRLDLEARDLHNR